MSPKNRMISRTLHSILERMNAQARTWDEQLQQRTVQGRLARRQWRRSQAALIMMRHEIATLQQLAEKQLVGVSSDMRDNMELTLEYLQRRIMFLQEDMGRFQSRFQ